MHKRRKKLRYKNILILISMLLITLIGTVFFLYLFDVFKNNDDNGETIVEPLSEPPVITYDYLKQGGLFELPITGATGFSAISQELLDSPSVDANIITILSSGQGFVIIEEADGWWYIEFNGFKGWVLNQNCLINLPDILPSIIYDNTNAYLSKLKSSGIDIPNITGKVLYNSFYYSERFEEEMYVVPVSYTMAFKISAAQQAALKDGNTLIIYEAYRPYDVQKLIVENLSELAENDSIVMTGITTPPWSINWFIATGYSNHQRGSAIDVSLGKVISNETKITGNYKYIDIKEYNEYTMPTEIHELSISSAIFQSPVTSLSDSAWLDSIPSSGMNIEALLLQKYCTDAGLTPLSSEWWHFNDLSITNTLIEIKSIGDYHILGNFSEKPVIIID